MPNRPGGSAGSAGCCGAVGDLPGREESGGGTELLPPTPESLGEETGGGTEPRPPALVAPDVDEEGGCSTSEDGATDARTVALLVEQGTSISKSSSCRKSKEEFGT